MQIEQLALLFALVIAANLVLLIALQLPRLGRRVRGGPDASGAYAGPDRGATSESRPNAPDEVRRAVTDASIGLPPALYQRMTRVVSFVFIGAAMAIVALTAESEATAIIVLLAFGLILIELFQDILPVSALGKWRLPLEAAVVLGFLTVLIAMTGGHDSPYFFGYILLVGAAALSTSDVGAAGLAAISSFAYIVAVVIAPGVRPLTGTDFGMVAFNLVSISLVMYVASVIGREQRRAREEALKLSRFDSLTALHSRDYFMSELEQEILRATRSGRPFSVAMVDLDGLKAANDRFGHSWGDNLLKAVGDVLKGDIRVTDVAARYGGDEFVLMLPETDLSGAILVAEKVRVDISRIALPHNGAVVRTSASIGLVTFPDDGRSSAELMRRADLAMYEAKRRGRDQIVRFARDGSAPPASSGPRVHTSGQPPAPTATNSPSMASAPAQPSIIQPDPIQSTPLPSSSGGAPVAVMQQIPDRYAQAGQLPRVSDQPANPGSDAPLFAAPGSAPADTAGPVAPLVGSAGPVGAIPPASPGRAPWES